LRRSDEMTSGNIDPAAVQAVIGQSGWVKKGKALPHDILRVGVILAMEGPAAQILEIVEVTGEVPANGDATLRVKTQSLGDKNVVKLYTFQELEAIRPLGYVIPQAGVALQTFVEGGLYQAFPNGRLYTVQHGYLVDTFRGSRLFGANAEDRKFVPRLVPIFVPRWVPQAPAAPRGR
jgi:hypothetical protein